jgi:large subunit ribosomal protein L22
MAEQTVKLNYLRMTARKVRLVADSIRGMSVNEAEAQLMFQRRRPSSAILKLLRSAVASAKLNKLNPDKLVISKITVDQGPMLKRIMLRARGSASGIQKKMSHVTLTLTENPNLGEKRFNIVIQKKAKLPPEEGKKKKTPEIKEEGRKPPTKSEKRPGFFQKVFRRKSI